GMMLGTRLASGLGGATQAPAGNGASETASLPVVAATPSPTPAPTPSPTPTPTPTPSPTPPPTPSPTPKPTPTARPTVHVVRRGETLSVIALRYGVTVEAIQAANGIKDPNIIVVGQRLTIPPP
ncbi:MAG: LysM peptidoglycan-binding domain-containing protein, partial [Chloroflexi bacterium]|nr:LysM peptidoglycan-binding domain-containing protein [Chloroflexota bacterium]